MFRKSLLALALLLSGTGCAVADTNNTNVMTMTNAGQAASESDYPSQPGPYTVIYRAWSDLAG